MRSIQGRTRLAGMAAFFSAAVMAAGMSVTAAPVQAAFELPEGEKITNVPAIPRAIPQKEAYELYDPKIGKNFDLKNFWMRADVRVRPEMRNASCFGSTFGNVAGACNNGPAATAGAGNGTKGRANDSYVQQWVRLGIGYDLSPDVNFYMELIDSAVWGGNGTAGGLNGAAGVDALNHNGSTAGGGGNNGRLGVRAAYMLIRNFAGVQGLSLKAGRQYVIFGNHSLFGHFDWANTGFSHDGVMLQYSTKSIDTYLGWFKTAESDLGQAAAVGSLGNNLAGTNNSASADGDMVIFYNQIKSIPGFLIEPYYIFYRNGLGSGTMGTNAFGNGAPKHANQVRHTVGNRIEMRKGNWDAINETVYQGGSQGDGIGAGAAGTSPGGCVGSGRCLSINAWATRNWVGYTMYESAWKPRLAFNFDYASGDGRNNCASSGVAGGVGACKTANTFENFFPTNHIHMGYMDVQAWKNMMSPSVNFQARPSKDDHIEFWYTNLNLASARDNWYRGAQGAYVFSALNNTKKHIGDELDFSWTHMMMDGKLAFQATYGYMFAGSYIEQNLGTSTNQQWGYVQLWMNF